MRKYNSTKSNSGGFTLIEIMISVLILGLVLSATSYLLSSNLSSANLIKNNFVASGLTQEGIEIVRNIRDSDWHKKNVFGTSIPDGTYNVQWDSASLTMYDSGAYLKRDGTSGLFNYGLGETTAFQRSVTITTVVPDVEKKVVTSVSWSERGRIKTISAEDHLFNWR